MAADNEIQQLMDEAGYEATSLFGQLDEDHDGRVSYDEFMEIFKALNAKYAEDHVEEEEAVKR